MPPMAGTAVWRSTQEAPNSACGVALDTAGNIYISDLYNNRLRKVDTSGVITTVAGNGNAAFGGDGGPAAERESLLAIWRERGSGR